GWDGEGEEATIATAAGEVEESMRDDMDVAEEEDIRSQKATEVEKFDDTVAVPDAHIFDGKPVGLLAEYLEGSPLLNDLLAVWDLPVRTTVSSVATAHTEALVAVLECIGAVVHKGHSQRDIHTPSVQPIGG
ncbi:unnamed protein product, partial [Choristocarpus tenellus]